VDRELLALVEKQSGKKAVTVRPADLLEPGLPSLRDKLKEKNLPDDDETAVLFAMFPVETEKLLRGEKPAAPAAVTASAPARPGIRPKKYVMHIEGKKHHVEVEEVA
jgi:pyruvate/oxaloacetate carboxyltransferase